MSPIGEIVGVATVQRLLDDYAVRGAILTYCRGTDRAGMELVRSTFHEHAEDTRGGQTRPHDEFVAWTAELLQHSLRSQHFVGNILVDFPDDRPNVALTETYAVTWRMGLDPSNSRNSITCGVRYLDRFELRPSATRLRSERRIAHRIVVSDWEQEDHLARPAGVLLGLHGGSDPSYSLTRTTP